MLAMTTLTIRGMTPRDLDGVAELSGQWGYSSDRDIVERRFRRILSERDHALFVAEGEGGRVTGWIHVHSLHSLEADSCAEIGGLVVDNRLRRLGAGRALVAHAEQWARDHGFTKIRVRSNVLRTEAHRFYPAVGFALNKTQHVYDRAI
jgi:GNAT superfamily N-acetyltransferase